jgi:hypothetical protein
MKQNFNFQGKFSKVRFILIITFLAAVMITGVAFAQVDPLKISTKGGEPTELVADGKSQQESARDPEIPICKVVKPENLGQQGESNELDVLLGFDKDEGEELPTVTANGTLTESMSRGSNPMGTTFQLSADFSAGTINGTLKGGRTSTPGGWMNCYDLADPSTEFDRIDVNTTDSYEASFSGSIDKETGEFSIAITPIGGTSATKVSLFTHEECLDKNNIKYPGEGGWNGKGTISGGVSKDGGIEFSTSWTYSWFYGEVQVNGQWSGTGIVSTPKEEENEDGATSEIDPEVSPIDSSPEEEENEVEDTSEIEPEVSTLVTSLESFLRSAGLSHIDPARLAAAGTGVSALIAIWMIVQHRSGIPMEKLEQAIGQWRWREGGELPETRPEVETTPDTPPDKLPETEKGKKESKPPSSLPEQEDPGEGTSATASESFDEPTSEDSASAPPSKAKKPSGETGEEWLERQVDNTEDLRAAVDKTISDFKKRLEEVPEEVKESKFWKEKVAPKLKKLDDLGIEGKSGKLKEFLRIAKDLLQVRKRVDAELAVFSREDREGVVWLVRGLQAGQEGLSKLHSHLITDPAIKAAKALLPKKQAEAVEKFLNNYQTDFETMLKGIKDLPINLGKTMGKAMHLDQNVGIVKNDTAGVYDSKWKHEEKGFDITQSPREKLGPVIKYVEDTVSAIRKKLGRTFIFLRDTTPKQE